MKKYEKNSIAKTWWGKSWNYAFDQDFYYSANAQKGRSLFRKKVIDNLQFNKGLIQADVSGSSEKPYFVKIKIEPLRKSIWNIKSICLANHVDFTNLKNSNIPIHIKKMFTDQNSGIFPKPDNMNFSCNCPMKSNMCKHIFALLYAVSQKIDTNPEIFFQLMDVDIQELKELDDIDEFPRKILKKKKIEKLRGKKISQAKKRKNRKQFKQNKKNIKILEKPIPLTAKKNIQGFIFRSRKGITINQLSKKTGYNKKKIYNIINKLKNNNKIISISWGKYMKI